MYLKKNLSVLVLVCLALVMACKNENGVKQTDQTENKTTMSTDLVNNPSTPDGRVVSPDHTGLLVFDDTLHDFGQVSEGELIQYDFEYTNKGSKEVIITNAKGSCGCTVPEYDAEPIAPGSTGIMKVTFNSEGRSGYNEKNVLITTNGVPAKYRLTILAEVK